jgi:hypothetical protein
MINKLSLLQTIIFLSIILIHNIKPKLITNEIMCKILIKIFQDLNHVFIKYYIHIVK